MTDTRRTILTVVFCASAFMLWDKWNVSQGNAPFFGPAPAVSQPVAAASGAAPGQVPQPTTTGTAPVASTTPQLMPSATGQIVIETDVIKATVDARGGDLIGLQLLKHRATDHSAGNVQLFTLGGEHQYLAQTGLVGNPAWPNHLSVMKAVPGERTLKDGQTEVTLRLESDVQGGVQYVKTLHFPRGSYAITVDHEVVNRSGAPIVPQLYLQLLRDGSSSKGGNSYYSTFTGPAFYTEAKKYQKVEIEKIKEGKAEFDKKSDNGWVAMVEHYFVSAWLLPEKAEREYFAKEANHIYTAGALMPLGTVNDGQAKTVSTRLYAGPQDENTLEKLAPGMVAVKDYGIFSILAKPLFWVLNQVHQLVGNWGWAIVGLVVLLKAALYWLNASAYRSMAKMKAAAPKLTAIRERHKDDPQKQQQEMMRIYREEKVNPLGGCLPMVIQMPVFIALYWVILSSIELRDAAWLGWITDLSVKDPYYVLPTLMTLSTVLQTWLNPKPDDPMQAKMMWIMPLAFSVMFFFFPAGLVLYWLTNNLLSIAQQWLINKQLGVN